MEAAYPKVYMYRRIVQAKLFIDVSFAEKPDLSNIADTAYFSKFHFIRLFKKIYGHTPHQYLTRVRVENACLLLANGYTVSHACFAVGFDSLSSFTGLFKKTMGKTPSQYRDEQLLRKNSIARSPMHFVPNCFVESNGWNKSAILEK